MEEGRPTTSTAAGHTDIMRSDHAKKNFGKHLTPVLFVNRLAIEAP